MKNFDEQDPSWDRTRSLLREHLQAPKLEHPDFVNSRVMEAIERLEKPVSKTSSALLRRLFWAGSGALAAAVLLTFIVLPGQMGPREPEEFISQVIDARTFAPQLSVSSFQAPGERAAVIWLEGTEYIPASEAVR